MIKRDNGENIYVPKEITSAFSKPDYPFPDSENYLVVFKTDKTALKGILPEGFYCVPEQEDIVMLRVNRFSSEESKIRPYWEMVISIPAVYGEGENSVVGEYVSQLYLGCIQPESMTTPTLSGQLYYGYPKREAIFSVTGDFGVNDVKIRISRHNNLLLDMDVKEFKDPTPIDTSIAANQMPMMVLKTIPNAGGKGWDVLEVNIPTAKDGSVVMKEMRAVGVAFSEDLKLDTGRSIPINQVIRATYIKFDWTLSQGVLLHDYLER